MPSLIRKVEEPQDIYVLGTCCEVENHECKMFGITDDYATIDFYVGDKEVLGGFDNVGYIYVFTKDELKAIQQRLVDDDMFFDHAGLDYETGLPERGQYITKYGAILRNFSGDINVGLIDEKTGKCYLNHYDVDKDSYMYEVKDEDALTDEIEGRLEERILLPEGSVVKEVSVYEILDELNGATYMDAPDLKTLQEIDDAIQAYKKHHNFLWDIEHLIFKPYFLGYVTGRGFEDIASEHMETWVAGGKPNQHGQKRPLFLHDITDDLVKRDVDIDYFMAQLFFSTSVYRKKFNEWYKPLTRPLDKVIEDSSD